MNIFYLQRMSDFREAPRQLFLRTDDNILQEYLFYLSEKNVFLSMA